MRIDRITLVQPRHIYAPKPKIKQYGHIYMPTSLLAAAAILLNLRIDVIIHDENISGYSDINGNMGLNLLGAPYINKAVEFKDKLNNKFGDEFTLLLGGQIINGFTIDEFYRLFHRNAHNGNLKLTYSKLLDIDSSNIPTIENLSLVPAYSLLKNEHLKLYLENESGFYLSQGCKYSCTFCSAEKSGFDSVIGKYVRKSEVYRDIRIATEDLEYLIKKAIGFGLNTIKIYLSNLDLFQTPSKLNIFANSIKGLKTKYSNFNLLMRGLSTTRSFMKAHNKYPEVIKNIVSAGLHRVGFGIDGATQKVYRLTKKPQTEQECLDAISIARLKYGITPETLMVFGHNRKDDEESLKLAVDFCSDMGKKYNSFPRPHVAKDIVPGNSGWFDNKNVSKVDYLISNPSVFQNLDFTSLPSPFTHPDIKFRELVKKYFIQVCNLPNSLTQFVKPVSPDLSRSQLNEIIKYNEGKYDI